MLVICGDLYVGSFPHSFEMAMDFLCPGISRAYCSLLQY
jgi:hypothetical protein